MKLTVVLILLSLTTISFSQNEWWKKKNDSTIKSEKAVENNFDKKEDFKSDQTVKVSDSNIINPGRITVVKSPGIEKVIKFKSSTIPPNSQVVMDGYRVQLFFDQDRKEVDKARIKSLDINNKEPTYIEYKAPNYMLLLGNYRTRLEAEKVRSKILSEFPEAIVREDKIHLPKIKDDEE